MEATTTTAKYLEDLLPRARAAHNGTSFDPEKRGRQMIDEYEECLTSDLEQIANAQEDVKAHYIARFRRFLGAWMCAKSRCVSTMIAGPSNFPVHRQQKYGRWEDNAYSKFKEFREKAIAGISKDIERAKSPEQKMEEGWVSIKNNILSSAATVIGIDRGELTQYARPLFVNSITGLVKRMAKNGQAEHVRRSLALIRELNKQGPKPIVTEKNAIFKLAEVAAEIKADKEHEMEAEPNEILFEGGKIVLNHRINRIQIIHNSKPPYERIIPLKINAFRWSPREGAWQRHLNNAGKYAVEKALGIKIDWNSLSLQNEQQQQHLEENSQQA